VVAAGLETATEPVTVSPSSASPSVRAALLLAPLDRAAFDRLRLGTALRNLHFDDTEISRTRVALGLPGPSNARDPRRLASAWLADPAVREFIGVHEWETSEWFDKEAFESILDLVSGLERAAGARVASPAIGRLRRAAASAGYRVDLFLEALGPEAATDGRSSSGRRRSRPPSS